MTKKARAAAKKSGQRGGKSRSPAKAKAARANGQRGGRPRLDLSEEFKQVGRAPIGDPLKINEWAQKINARMMELIISGQANGQLVSQIASLTRGIIGTTPAERLHQAGKRIKAAQAPTKPTARKGPDLEEFGARPPGTGGGTSLRR